MSAVRERVRPAAVSLRRAPLVAPRRGQAIIEFALILPLFLILIGGVVDFGMFMFQREQAASCVRTVARKASVRSEEAMSLDAAPQCQRASDQGVFRLKDENDDTVQPEDLDDMAAGSDITAEVDYDYEPFFLSLDLPGLDPIELMQVTAEVTMRMEGQEAP